MPQLSFLRLVLISNLIFWFLISYSFSDTPNGWSGVTCSSSAQEACSLRGFRPPDYSAILVSDTEAECTNVRHGTVPARVYKTCTLPVSEASCGFPDGTVKSFCRETTSGDLGTLFYKNCTFSAIDGKQIYVTIGGTTTCGELVSDGTPIAVPDTDGVTADESSYQIDENNLTLEIPAWEQIIHFDESEQPIYAEGSSNYLDSYVAPISQMDDGIIDLNTEYGYISSDYVEVDGVKYTIASHNNSLNIVDGQEYTSTSTESVIDSSTGNSTTVTTTQTSTAQPGLDQNSPVYGSGTNSGGGSDNGGIDVCPDNYTYDSSINSCVLNSSGGTNSTSSDSTATIAKLDEVKGSIDEIKDALNSDVDIPDSKTFDESLGGFYQDVENSPLVSSIKGVSNAFNHPAGVCPVLSFTIPLLGQTGTFSTSLHCTIYDSVKLPLGFVMLALYSVLGVIIILRA